MMDGLVTSHNLFSAGASGEAILYKLSKDRSTVVDNARCFAIQCYLNMCQYHYKLVECNNADYMSPSKMSPFLIVPTNDGHLFFSTFKAITNYIEAQDKGLTSTMENVEKARITALCSLINDIVIAEQYYTWIHYETYKNGTLPATGGDKVWPLNVIVPITERMSFIWNNFSLYRMQESEVLEHYEQSIWGLSHLLEEGNGYSSSGKCLMDALAYGHVEAIRKSNITQLSTPLQKYPNLLQLIDTVKHEYFNIGMMVEE